MESDFLQCWVILGGSVALFLHRAVCLLGSAINRGTDCLLFTQDGCWFPGRVLVQGTDWRAQGGAKQAGLWFGAIALQRVLLLGGAAFLFPEKFNGSDDWSYQNNLIWSE